MKTTASLLVLVPALLLTGCNSKLPHSQSDEISLIARHPDRHIGELVSCFGQVLDVQESDGGTVFQIATPNFLFSFVVTYRGEIPGLVKDQGAYFLGRVTGSVQMTSSAYTGVPTVVNAVTVDAIAIQPVGGTPSHPFSTPDAVYRPEDASLARAWLRKDLELSEMGARQERAVLPAAPVRSQAAAPAAAAPPPAAARIAPRAPEYAPGGSEAQEASKDLQKFMKAWRKLSPEDQARFLELVGPPGWANPAR